MKKFLLVLMTFFCLSTAVFAEDAAPAAVSASDGTPLITSLPERKAPGTLKDVLTPADAQKVQKLVSDMIVDYNLNKNRMSPETWSQDILKRRLTGVSGQRVGEITAEIGGGIKLTAEKKQALDKAVQGGESKQNWLEGQVSKYIKKAVDATTTTPEEGSKNQMSGFSLAEVDFGGRSLTDLEAETLRQELLADNDTGLKTAVAAALVLAANDPSIKVVGNAAPRLLATIAINSVEEAKTVLKVKNGSISGKEGAVRLGDMAMASIVGLLAGFDYKQIGFIAGTAAGTAAGGAIDGATGGISLGTITINGALIGAYLGEKIGTKLGATLNQTLDAKLHAKIVSEFEGFIGNTVLIVLNIRDVKPAVEQIDQAAGEAAQEAGIKPEPAQGQPGLPADAGYLDKAWYYLKQSGSWCADKASAAWNGLVDLIGSGWQVMTGYWDLGYKKATGMF